MTLLRRKEPERAPSPKPVRTHRAAVFVEPGRAVILDVNLEGPAANDVLVRLEGCGLCASNVPVWQGRTWFKYPMPPGSPGHEGWGIVESTGSDVTGFSAGERVALISQRAYAHHDVAPAAALVRLPRELDRLPFPGEPLGCAMNVFERSGIESVHTVAIVGSGFLGVLLTQLAARTSAGVFVTSRRASSLQQARRAGACETMVIDDPARVIEEGMRLTGGRGFDRVIEAAGEQSTLDVASALTAEHGRLVIAGYHQDGKREVNMQEWNWRGIDVINAHERSLERQVKGISRAVAATLDGRMDPFPLFTHQFPLPAIEEAFGVLQARPAGFMKALVLTT